MLATVDSIRHGGEWFDDETNGRLVDATITLLQVAFDETSSFVEQGSKRAHKLAGLSVVDPLDAQYPVPSGHWHPVRTREYVDDAATNDAPVISIPHPSKVLPLNIFLNAPETVIVATARFKSS